MQYFHICGFVWVRVTTSSPVVRLLNTYSVYALVMTNITNWKIPIEIVNFSINSMVIFHSYVSLPEGSFFLTT